MTDFNSLQELEQLKIKQAIRELVSEDMESYRAAVHYLYSLEDEVYLEAFWIVGKDPKENLEVRREALSRIRYYQHDDARWVKPLLEMLGKDHPDLDLEIIGALGVIKDETGQAVEPLLQLIRDPQLDYSAIVALGQIGDKRAVEPLRDLLEDLLSGRGNQVATFFTVEALVILGSKDERLTRYLIDFLLNREHDKVMRYNAATLLGELGHKQSIEPLLEVLQDYNRGVRSSSALALSLLGAVEAVEPIIKLLKDPDPLVRDSAAIALGKLKDKRAIVPLIEALNDTAIDNMIRRSAALALHEITSMDYSAWEILKSSVGKTIKSSSRVFYAYKGQVDTSEGPLQIEFTDDSIILLRVAGDGETFIAEKEHWKDPFEGKLDEENLEFIEKSGKAALFDVSNSEPYLALVNSVIEQCYPIIDQFNNICGVQVQTSSTMFNFVIQADEERIYWGDADSYFSEWGYKLIKTPRYEG